MGRDKGAISYHGIPQRDYLYELLNSVCEQTFISLRQEQNEIDDNRQIILDNDLYKGPFNGLFSAHKAFPEAAWLVLACDLPLIEKNNLKQLVSARDPNVLATAFATKASKLPEPLCAIWEPRAFERATRYIAKKGNTCPRKFLINSEIKLVFPENDRVLLNANAEADYKEALASLKLK